MSEIKVNKVTPRSGSTVTVGDGAGEPVTVDAATVNLGRCGGTVALACGATQTGFGRTGTVDWCTTVKTSPLTAVSGKGYFINTCGGAVTVTLPSSPSAGDSVKVRIIGTNYATIARNSSNIESAAENFYHDLADKCATFTYANSSLGWQVGC